MAELYQWYIEWCRENGTEDFDSKAWHIFKYIPIIFSNLINTTERTFNKIKRVKKPWHYFISSIF